MEHAFLEYKYSYLLLCRGVWWSYKLVKWVRFDVHHYLHERIEVLSYQIMVKVIFEDPDDYYWTSYYWPLPYIEVMAYPIILRRLDYLLYWSNRVFFVLEELHDWLLPFFLWLADPRFFRPPSFYSDLFFLLDGDDKQKEDEEDEDEDTDEDQG